MNGPEHYAEAERLLTESTIEPELTPGPGILFTAPGGIDVGLALQALVHATLADTAANVARLSPVVGDRINAAGEWSDVIR